MTALPPSRSALCWAVAVMLVVVECVRAGGLPCGGLGQCGRPNACAGIPRGADRLRGFRTSPERRKRHPDRRPSLRRLSRAHLPYAVSIPLEELEGPWRGSALPTPASCSTAVGLLARGAAVRRPFSANGDSTASTVSTAELHGGWPRAASSSSIRPSATVNRRAEDPTHQASAGSETVQATSPKSVVTVRLCAGASDGGTPAGNRCVTFSLDGHPLDTSSAPFAPCPRAQPGLEVALPWSSPLAFWEAR